MESREEGIWSLGLSEGTHLLLSEVGAPGSQAVSFSVECMHRGAPEGAEEDNGHPMFLSVYSTRPRAAVRVRPSQSTLGNRWEVPSEAEHTHTQAKGRECI